ADADALGRARLAVMHEDVVLWSRVVGHEVRSSRAKNDEAAVGADRRWLAGAVRLLPEAVDADPHRLARLPVVHEDVGRLVRVARHEIRGVRLKSNKAAVAADR